jgi:hypothetical protein
MIPVLREVMPAWRPARRALELIERWGPIVTRAFQRCRHRRTQSRRTWAIILAAGDGRHRRHWSCERSAGRGACNCRRAPWTATVRGSRCNNPTLATVLLLGLAAGGGLAPQATADERPAATVDLGTDAGARVGGVRRYSNARSLRRASMPPWQRPGLIQRVCDQYDDPHTHRRFRPERFNLVVRASPRKPRPKGQRGLYLLRIPTLPARRACSWNGTGRCFSRPISPISVTAALSGERSLNRFPRV